MLLNLKLKLPLPVSMIGEKEASVFHICAEQLGELGNLARVSSFSHVPKILAHTGQLS